MGRLHRGLYVFLGCSYDSFSSAIWDAAPAYNRQSTLASAVADDRGSMDEIRSNRHPGVMRQDRCVLIASTRRQTLTPSRRSVADQPNDKCTR